MSNFSGGGHEMKPFQRARRIAAALIAVGSMALGHEAHALSVGPGSGFATNPTLQYCFDVGMDAAQNGCDQFGSISFTVPLTANAGSHTVRLYGTNYQGNGLACGLCNYDQDGGYSCVLFPTFPVGNSIQTATTTVGQNGGLFVSCGVGFFSVVSTINYNQ